MDEVLFWTGLVFPLLLRLVANADSNGVENIRQKVLPNPPQDRDNSWLAQPAVRLFDRSEGSFTP